MALFYYYAAAVYETPVQARTSDFIVRYHMIDRQRRPLYRRWWFWLLAGLLMFLLGYLVGRSFTPQGRINPLEVILFSEALPARVSNASHIT